MSFLTKIFGDPNKKAVDDIRPIVDTINALETEFEKLSDGELKHKTIEFKELLAKGETLEDILPEAFATVREASKRATGMRHFDVQLIGGVVLHRGHIAEMRTGEGKTLVATLPVYLNALEGKGVHVVTVNDYLAKRDATWMAKIYDFLGMSVGIVQNQRVTFVYDANVRNGGRGTGDEAETIKENESEIESFKVENEFLRPASRREAYQCDITYGTNNEFGFDYLRDNMVQTLEEMVMRPGDEMHYAIVDEVDSILIDEARTPLIISAPAEEATEQYYQFAKLVKQLKENDPDNPSNPGDYNVDEKMRSATLTEAGIAKFEQWLGIENLYVEGGVRMVHHVEQALKAEMLFKRDKDYIVDGQEVVIVDEFTGHKMPGRRYSEGLHQAIEAKEGVNIQRESQTLATITFQNLFRMYRKLAGMTGTAVTEAEELGKIYSLEVIAVPTNKPDNRVDNQDRIYKHEQAKFNAIVERVKECQAKGQPMLIGTISVEKNEVLSQYLTMNGIQHEVLNAKNHEREGQIIAQAGRPGAVTLATNMAGRGVDIKLGGVPADPMDTKKVIDVGGLFVLGTERHESRRIDNQLRGRAARQGDPGETQFFVSTDDDLMRIFAGDRLKNVMTRLKLPDDMPIEQSMITKMLETAQKKVESHNFDIRKHLLDYDDVLNKQRGIIYKKRRQILDLVRKELEKNEQGIGVQQDHVIEEIQQPAVEQVDGGLILEHDGASQETVLYHSLRDMILEMVEQEIEFVVTFHTNADDKQDWNLKEIYETMSTMLPLNETDREEIMNKSSRGNGNLGDVEIRDGLIEFLVSKAKHEYDELVNRLSQQVADPKDARKMIVHIEKSVLLRAIDNMWVDYLVAMDYLRAGIGLRGYGQRDPLVEYKKESFQMFNQLQSDIQKEVAYMFFKVNVGLQIAPSIMANDKLTLKGAEKTTDGEAGIVRGKQRDDEGHKVGRNDPCPCGSGKKYKKCHGA